MIRLIYLLLVVVLFSLPGKAGDFEIRAVNAGNGVIRVEMRETSGTTPSVNDFVTDIVFGLKWSTSYNVDLGAIDNSAGYNMIKSGGREVNGAFHFQAFGANSTPYNFPVNWTTGVWTEIMSISNTLNGSLAVGDFQITEVGFDQTTDPNIGVNLADFTPLINGDAEGVALPIELLSFSAVLIDGAVDLTWLTTNERYFNGFDLEHSTDGRSWRKLAFIPGRGTVVNELQEYTYWDLNPHPGLNFYRLKIIDLDQTFKYSPIRVIQISKKALALSVYPNPTNDYLQVELLNQGQDARLQLLDLNGSTVREMMIFSGIGTEQLDVTSLPSGTYFLKVNSLEASISRKIIIQR